MTALVALPVVLIAASSAALLLDEPIESLVPPTLFAMTLCVYVFGLLDALSLGFWCVMLSVVGLTGYAAARFGRAGLRKTLAGLSSPGIILYVVFALLLFAVTRDMQLAHYDEFSHWGRVVRAMFLHDALGPHNPVELGFRSYPPASATFEYVVLRLGGGWTEGNLFWAYQLLYGAVFLPFVARLRWRDPVSIAASAFLLFATPHLILNPLRATLVDPLLGALFGYLLAVIYVSDARKWSLTAYVSLGLAMLVLMKDSGAFFAGVVLIAYLLRLLRSELAKSAPASRKAAAARFATAVAATWAARESWDRLLSATDVSMRFAAPIDPRELLGFLTGDVRSYWPEVMDNYASAFVRSPIVTARGVPVTQLVWFVLFAVVLIATTWAAGRSRGKRPEWEVPIVAFGGGAAYTIILLVFYLYRFRVDQAVALASYGRYLGTYWAGLAAFVTFVLLWSLISVRTDGEGDRAAARRAVYIVVACWCVILLFLVPMKDAVASYVTVPRFNEEVRQPYAVVAQRIEQADIDVGSRVLVLSENAGGGYEGQVIQYLLVNADVDFRSPETTATPSRESSQAEIIAYDYVVVFSGSREQLARFDELLVGGRAIGTGTVYRVERDGDEARLLEQNP